MYNHRSNQLSLLSGYPEPAATQIRTRGLRPAHDGYKLKKIKIIRQTTKRVKECVKINVQKLQMVFPFIFQWNSTMEMYRYRPLTNKSTGLCYHGNLAAVAYWLVRKKVSRK